VEGGHGEKSGLMCKKPRNRAAFCFYPVACVIIVFEPVMSFLCTVLKVQSLDPVASLVIVFLSMPRNPSRFSTVTYPGDHVR
jgi:hypothetical protein